MEYQIRMYTTAILDKITPLTLALEDLQLESHRLQSLDPAKATPSWHRDAHGTPKYLYLIYPQLRGKRRREYIGSKPDRITAALARVQAHRDLVQGQRQTADIKARLDLVSRYLAAALRAAEGGKD